MSKKNSVEISDFEFESDDLEWLMKYKVKFKNIMGKEEDDDAIILPDLPPEIIYKILVNIPPHYLQQLRLVCKAWENMFTTNDFILDNFARNSMKTVFLVQRDDKVYRMEIDEKQLDYILHEIKLRCMGKFISSCYGMLLSCYGTVLRNPAPARMKYVLKVLDSKTRCCLTLPECPSGCPHKNCGSALGFDPCRNVFKVVHMYADGFGFEIFTIGDSCNAWKQIPGPWEDSFERPQGLLKWGWSDPVPINGRFLHWNVLSSEFVLSMDVSDEKIIKLQLPNIGQIIRRYSYRLLELGGHLSWAYCTSCTRMDIWILEDFRSKLWFKKHTIDAEMIDYIDYIVPALKNKLPKFKNKLPDFKALNLLAATSNGVLVFQYDDDKRIYFYDVEKKRMKKFKSRVDNLIVHRSSLFKLQQT